jgi:hypothetical protein
MSMTYPCYSSKIEEHFTCLRGTTSFMLSPNDCHLAKTWYNAGIPLEAVARGLDRAFATFRKRAGRASIQRINSLAYCTHAVLAEAKSVASGAETKGDTGTPLTIESVSAFVTRNAAVLEHAGFEKAAASLYSLDVPALFHKLDVMDERLTEIEAEINLELTAAAGEIELTKVRSGVDAELNLYRGKLSKDQLETLKKRFLERRLYEASGLPRLGLNYLPL